jgi:chemosensory pili system protein ChpC
MSKKNRNKFRAAHSPSRPSAAPVTVARDADAAAFADEDNASSSDDPMREPSAMLADPAESGAMAMAADADTDTGVDIDVSSQSFAVASTAGDAQAASDDDAEPETSAQPAAEAQAPAPLPFTVPTPAPMASQGDIRGVLIQVAGARLLLPNATIAEVLSYADPEPVGADAPAWLLGRLRWRGWQVPLLAFGTLAGVAEERAVLGSKVVVLKALAGTSRTPYFAMLTQGFPRLVTVSRQALSVEDDNAEAMPRGVQARVRLNEDPALLPDLEAIEALVADAVANAA